MAFYEQDTIKTLPPLQLTIDILNRGISSINRAIALTCEHGLSILEKLCQPVCPSLFISEAITTGEINENFESIVGDKVIKETKDASEFEQSGHEGEPNLPAISIKENGDVMERTEMNEENIETSENKEITENGYKSLPTLKTEPSVHIINVQIIKSSVSVNTESDDMVYAEDLTVNKQLNLSVVEQLQQKKGNKRLSS